MKTYILAGTTALALTAGTAAAQQVTVLGPWIGPDQEHVEAVLDAFKEATGIDYAYTGSDGFEQQIRIDVEAGSAPNVAVFPQPGLAADLASLGYLTRSRTTPPTGCARTMPRASPGSISAPMPTRTAKIRCSASSTKST